MISTRGYRDPAPQTQHHPTDADAPENLAGDDGGEHPDRWPKRKGADAHGRDREAIEDQRGRVIRQSFAFEDDARAAGSSIRRAIESGATGSGGETMAPSAKPTGQEKPSSQ